MDEEIVTRSLFGGAIEISLPKNFVDVNEFREIPDNQEVFTDTKTDRSLIVEILELSQELSGPHIAEFHFTQIASDNDADESTIFHTLPLNEDSFPFLGETNKTVEGYLLGGQQHVAKFNEHAKNMIQITLCVIRIKDVDVDLIISLNEPQSISPESSSFKNVGLTAIPLENGNTNKLLEMLKTFKIHDYSLFGG